MCLCINYWGILKPLVIHFLWFEQDAEVRIWTNTVVPTEHFFLPPGVSDSFHMKCRGSASLPQPSPNLCWCCPAWSWRWRAAWRACWCRVCACRPGRAAGPPAAADSTEPGYQSALTQHTTTLYCTIWFNLRGAVWTQIHWFWSGSSILDHLKNYTNFKKKQICL